MNIERIVITLEENGAFKGASSQDFGGHPVPIAEANLGELGDKIHASLLSALEAKDAEIAALTDFKSRAEAGIQAVVAAVQDERLDAKTTAATILQIVAQGTAPEAERKMDAIRQQIADLEKQLAPQGLPNDPTLATQPARKDSASQSDEAAGRGCQQ